MTLNFQVDEITLAPFKKDLESYSKNRFFLDLTAALSVALLTLPQALAYSVLAGLPLTCGLFASIYSAIFASAFGSSTHLVVGPSNAIAILIQAGTSEILFNFYREAGVAEKEFLAVQILTQLVFLTGLMQILAAVGKLGRLTQFVSHSVIVGYMAGTALAVLVNQLYTFLGIDRTAGLKSLYDSGVYLFFHLQEIHIPTALVGISSLVLLVFLRELDKKIPAAVVSLVYAAIVVYYLDFSTATLGYGIVDPFTTEKIATVDVIRDVGDLSEVLPTLQFPYFNAAIFNELLPISFAVALLSIMESTSVSKSIAASSGQRLSINQEIFGVGIGNMISGFITGMPISGSASRSGINFSLGAQTRFAAIYAGLIVGALIYLFGFFVNRIPLTALAALLLYTTTNIVNRRHLMICLKATGSDAFVFLTTFLACIFLSLDRAFYTGVIISIILYLKKSAVPQLVEYDVDESGELKNCHFSAKDQKEIRIIKVEGELFFGAADIFQTALKTLAEDDTNTKVMVIQLKNARDMDATSCLALNHLYEYMQSSNRHLIACGITQPVWDVLSDSGLVKLIGKENLFIFDERNPHLYMQKALQRAKRLAKQGTPPSKTVCEPHLEEEEEVIAVHS